MSYDRLAPTVSSKAKILFGSGNMGQNNWGAVPFSDGLDTRPCKILDPRLVADIAWQPRILCGRSPLGQQSVTNRQRKCAECCLIKLFPYIYFKNIWLFWHWKWPAQGTGTVPVVSAHFRSLWGYNPNVVLVLGTRVNCAKMTRPRVQIRWYQGTKYWVWSGSPHMKWHFRRKTDVGPL